MECIATIIVLYIGFQVLAWFLRAISSTNAEGSHENEEVTGPGALSVAVVSDKFRPRGTQETLPVLRVSISGNILVPNVKEPVTFMVRVLDVTTPGVDPLPVFCLIPDMADDNGLFKFEQNVDLPHRACSIEGLPLVGVPTFALVGPRSGRRKLQFLVFVVSRRDEDTVFGAGTAAFHAELVLPGFEELAERTQHRVQQIAQLALALAAADGRIEKRELAVVRRFFAERNAKISDQNERNRVVEKLMEEALSHFKGSKGAQLKDLTNAICDKLASENEEAVIQAAYELAVQVVAADDSVDEREQQTLAQVAKRLKVPAGFVKEVHDRNLRANMFGEGDVEALLGMPDGLSIPEKEKFLADEYRRWRGRVTHDDPKVAAEAALRLNHIAKARAALAS